jgi:hypothetical protein
LPACARSGSATPHKGDYTQKQDTGHCNDLVTNLAGLHLASIPLAIRRKFMELPYIYGKIALKLTNAFREIAECKMFKKKSEKIIRDATQKY